MSQFDQECLHQLTARNDLETYILNAQSEFSNGGIYFEFMTSEESDALIKEIFVIDDWLNDDWEMNKAPLDYIERLTKVKKIGDVYVLRYNEWHNRPLLLETYNKLINQFETWFRDERDNTQYRHITDEQIKELATHMTNESKWLSSRMREHSELAKCSIPPFLTEVISKRLQKTSLAFEKLKTVPRPLIKKKNKDYQKSEKKKDTENIDDSKHDETEKN